MKKYNDMYNTGNDYSQGAEFFKSKQSDGIYHITKKPAYEISGGYDALNKRIFNIGQNFWGDPKGVNSPDYATCEVVAIMDDGSTPGPKPGPTPAGVKELTIGGYTYSYRKVGNLYVNKNLLHYDPFNDTNKVGHPSTIITEETDETLGCLYSGEALSQILDEIKDTGWRLPTIKEFKDIIKELYNVEDPKAENTSEEILTDDQITENKKDPTCTKIYRWNNEDVSDLTQLCGTNYYTGRLQSGTVTQCGGTHNTNNYNQMQFYLNDGWTEAPACYGYAYIGSLKIRYDKGRFTDYGKSILLVHD